METQHTVITDTDLFDPMAFDDVSSAEYRVKDPITGAPSSMVITLAGPEHADRKRRLYARQRRLRAAMAKTGKLPMSDPEDDEADQLEDLVACTLGWKGSKFEYSKDAARKLYTIKRYLRDQVQAALDERELFIRSSADN